MLYLNPEVDSFLKFGCGRCPKYNTPECKVHKWTLELETLRNIVLETGLNEELKWKQPVYTINGKNVVLVSAFMDTCFISFFKGSLLKDPNGILQKAGANAQAARLIKFTAVSEIQEIQEVITAYIKEAIQLEKSGAKVVINHEKIELPEELQNKMDEFPAFKSAFEALTPGRQRGYIYYFAQPKQAKTRTARIEKYTDKIMQGIGLNDEYKC